MGLILIIEEDSAVGLDQLSHKNVDKQIVTGYGQAVNIDLSVAVGIHGQ